MVVASSVCRFVGGIRSEVEKLEKTLLLFSENLDEWLAVQQSWMYLESIFGAPDIQRQLPGPAKAFQAIDKEFRSIMRSVKQKPLALAVRFFSLSHISRYRTNYLLMKTSLTICFLCLLYCCLRIFLLEYI